MKNSIDERMIEQFRDDTGATDEKIKFAIDLINKAFEVNKITFIIGHIALFTLASITVNEMGKKLVVVDLDLQ